MNVLRFITTCVFTAALFFVFFATLFLIFFESKYASPLSIRIIVSVLGIVGGIICYRIQRRIVFLLVLGGTAVISLLLTRIIYGVHDIPSTPAVSAGMVAIACILILITYLLCQFIFTSRHPEQCAFSIRRFVWIFLIAIPITFAVFNAIGYVFQGMCFYDISFFMFGIGTIFVSTILAIYYCIKH